MDWVQEYKNKIHLYSLYEVKHHPEIKCIYFFLNDKNMIIDIQEGTINNIEAGIIPLNKFYRFKNQYKLETILLYNFIESHYDIQEEQFISSIKEQDIYQDIHLEPSITYMSDMNTLYFFYRPFVKSPLTKKNRYPSKRHTKKIKYHQN